MSLAVGLIFCLVLALIRGGKWLWRASTGLAALSATSLPSIPMLLGIQVRMGGVGILEATSRMSMIRDTLSFGCCYKRDCSADLESVNTTQRKEEWST